METKRILIERFLIKAIERLYHDDYVNIKFGVSERNICARLAHHIENIMREHDQQDNNCLFENYYADVEYNRMGNGDLKHYETSEHITQYMVSDLLVQSRGFKDNLLAVEMKRKGNYRGVQKDRERLISIVSPESKDQKIRCVHDTLLGAFIVYSPSEVTIEFYENVNGVGEMTRNKVLRF